MADSYVFDKPVTTPTFQDPDSIRILQSATLDGTFVQVGVDQLLSGLADNPDDPDQYLVNEALADDSLFTKLVFVTAEDVTGEAGLVEPQIATPDSFQLFAYGVDAGLDNVAGIELDAGPVGGVATAVDNTVIKNVRVETDVNGRASIDNMPADAGKFYINFGGQKKIIDTTGRGSTSVNWKDIT